MYNYPLYPQGASSSVAELFESETHICDPGTRLQIGADGEGPTPSSEQAEDDVEALDKRSGASEASCY